MESGGEIRIYKRGRLGYFRFLSHSNLSSNSIADNFVCSSFDMVITLIIGDEADAETVVAHKNIPCAASPFFGYTCAPDWMKPEDCVIKLPEDDKGAVEITLY